MPSPSGPDAEPHNDSGLARNNIRSACVEDCKQIAIKINVGVGIRIKPLVCDACGNCEYHCPVEPRTVSLSSPKLLA